jgi:hypothetical protein
MTTMPSTERLVASAACLAVLNFLDSRVGPGLILLDRGIRSELRHMLALPAPKPQCIGTGARLLF